MKKPREGYKMTELGEIPKEWEVFKLKEIGEIVTGNTPDTSNKCYYGEDYLWVSPIDLGKQKYVTNTNKKLSEIGFKKTRNLPKGSILVTCIGSTIGKIGIASVELSTNQQINSIICKNEFNNEYVYYSLSYYFRNYESFISTQAVPIINKSVFSELKLPIPTFSEQQKIADILSTVDEQIENIDKLIEKTKELKKGLMQRLLTKGIGHKEFKRTEIGIIPKEWEIEKISNVSNTMSGGTPNRSIKKFYANGTFPWLKTSELNKKYIFDTEEKITKEAIEKSSLKIIQRNAVLVAMYGATIGKISISKCELTTNQACCSVICNESRLYYEYLYYILNYNKNKLITLAAGAAQPNISQEIIRNFKIPIPSILEQQKIADILSTIDNKLEEYMLKKEKLEQLKKGLMQKLLTGKIRVKV